MIIATIPSVIEKPSVYGASVFYPPYSMAPSYTELATPYMLAPYLTCSIYGGVKTQYMAPYTEEAQIRSSVYGAIYGDDVAP